MATWNNVRSYISANFQVQSDDGTTMVLLFDTGGGRTQLVMVSGGDSYVSVSSPIGTVNQVDGNAILSIAQNHTAPGGIRQVGDMYVYSNGFATESLEGPELLTFMIMITQAADNIERDLGLGDTL